MKPPLQATTSFLGCATLCLVACTVASAGPTYTFANIADTGGPLVEVAGGSINDSGTVAFWGRFDDNPNNFGVYIGSGGSVARVYTGNIRRDFADVDPHINNGGTLMFLQYGVGGSETWSIVTGDTDGRPLSIIDSFANWGRLDSPALNNNGTVTYKASSFSGVEWVLAAEDSAAVRTIHSVWPGNYFSPAVDDSGRIGFTSNFEGVNGIYVSTGGSLSRLYDNTGVLANAAFAFDGLAMNNAGGVAFQARLSNGEEAIVTGDGGPATIIADTSGAFSAFENDDLYGRLDINDNGTLAFWASLDAGGSGIFVGPDALTDKVVATGDSLFGATVTGVWFGVRDNAINSSDQIVFKYWLDNGVQGIAVATPQAATSPVPEPASAVLFAMGSAIWLAWRCKRSRRRAADGAQWSVT